MFFGEFLISQSLITREQLNKGLAIQKKLAKPIGETLVELGFITKEELDKNLEIHLLNCAEKIVEDAEF